MTNRTEEELVADLKTRFGRRHEDKLVMQSEMAELRDRFGRTQDEIAKKTGIPQRTVSDWLQAWDEVEASRGSSEVAEPSRLTPQFHKDRSDRGVTKRTLREQSVTDIADILDDPAVMANVVRAQQIAYSRIEDKSRRAQREAIGADVDDALNIEQQYRDIEALMFKARRAVIEMLRALDAVTLIDLRDSWREQFLSTIDDIEAKVGLGRSLLAGDLETELEALLGGE